jgi:hypothetical protein
LQKDLVVAIHVQMICHFGLGVPLRELRQTLEVLAGDWNVEAMRAGP